MGGGKRTKSQKCLRKHLKNSSDHRSFFYKFKFFQCSGGVILIEFAFCVSVFVTLILYAHDLMRISRIKERLSFCSECAVNMFQNISQQRANKRITIQDYRYISGAAFIPYDGGDVEHYGADGSIVHPAVQMSVYYLKGIDDDKVKIIWATIPYAADVPTERREEIIKSGSIKPWVCEKGWRINQEYDAKSIHKDLHIKKDEVKILLDLYLCASWCKGSTRKDKEYPQTWGLWIYNPKAGSYGSQTGGWFHTYITFTPNPGLFDETPPA